ncbi:MAG TPA: FliM/FliN family flagellar motor switch protein [Solirubrobacteraceae bacterium]|nr:FliM/FliN family flagellar motor switch protein [Solirubrobacteraceae bacterium]
MSDDTGVSSTVDADRIAALMAAAGEDRRPAAGEAATGRRPRWLRTVDFSRPTKFTTDQERRLTRAVEAYCRTASARLAAERVPCELELLDCSQHTWSNAQAQVPPGSVISLAGVEPLGTRVVLSAETPLLLGALESLLGGTPERAPRDRKLTDIDLLLIRRVFETLVEALSSVLADHAGITLTVAAIDAAGETTYLEQPSEPTLTLTMEARLGRTSTVMVLLLPYHAVEPVLGRFSGRDDSGEATDPLVAGAVRAGVARVDVTVRAEVADRVMPVHEVLALKPGDVVKLGAAAGSHVTLFAEDVPVHTARPGRSGNRRAVQVVAPTGEAP